MKNLLLMSIVFLFVAGLACIPYMHQENDDFIYKGQSLSVWIGQLESTDVERRQEAAKIFCELGESGKEGVPALIKSTKDEDALVRFYAIRALSIIDPKNKDVIPAIANTIMDKDRAVAREATRAIMYSVRPGNAPPVGTFISQ